MSTRHTTVGQLTADDLGKRVEGDGRVIERLQLITHFDSEYSDGRPGTNLFGVGSNGIRRVPCDTNCWITDSPTPKPLSPEPLDPAYRHADKLGIEWARIEDVWVSPDHHPLSWEDLLERHGRGDS